MSEVLKFKEGLTFPEHIKSSGKLYRKIKKCNIMLQTAYITYIQEVCDITPDVNIKDNENVEETIKEFYEAARRQVSQGSTRLR